jgi:hypothetical protein
VSEPIANVRGILNSEPAITAIVADRIYMAQAEQTAQAPFVVFQLIANTPGIQLAGRPTYDAQLMQVDAYSRDPVEARTLAFACREALEAVAHVDRGPLDVGEDQVSGLHRWTLDAAFIWERGNG